MECHGTGTPLGDPIEIGGLKSINGSRCQVSSVASKWQDEYPFDVGEAIRVARDDVYFPMKGGAF